MEQEELQKSLIGALLQNPDQIPNVVHVIREKHVFSRRWQSVYDTIIRLWSTGEHVDLVTVTSAIGERYSADVAGAAIAEVGYGAAQTYAKLLVETYIRTSLDSLSKEISARAKRGEDAFSLLELAESSVFRLSNGLVQREFLSLGDTTSRAWERISTIQKLGPVGVRTGLGGLDETLGGGMQDGDLIILAGRPSEGKTALGLAIALHACSHGLPVGLISAEMSSTQLGIRLLAARSGIDSMRMVLGIMTEREIAEVERAKNSLRDLPLYIEDTGSISVHEVRARARKLKVEKGLGLLVVDYLQLLTGGKHQSREQEVSHISKVLKNTAKELGVPVLCLCQLSRAIELRSGRRPILSDLRESGAIEQDADVVIFIHGKRDENDTTRELSVAKQRNGPLADFEVSLDERTGRFHISNRGTGKGGEGELWTDRTRTRKAQS